MSDKLNFNKKRKLTATELAAALEHVADSSDDDLLNSNDDVDSSEESSSDNQEDDLGQDDDSDANVEKDIADEEQFKWTRGPALGRQ